MKHFVEQGSDEWRLIRAGKITGSRISDIMSKGKGGSESVGRRNYRMQLALEIIHGKPMGSDYTNGHMERGNILEAAARECYEYAHTVDIEQVGFEDHHRIDGFGVSVDGEVGTDGLIQIKCHIPAIHWENVNAGGVPAEYVKQMQAEMACTGRQWNDYVAYCPEMPGKLQLFVHRLYRDEQQIMEIEEAVIQMRGEVEELVSRLRAKC